MSTKAQPAAAPTESQPAAEAKPDRVTELEAKAQSLAVDVDRLEKQLKADNAAAEQLKDKLREASAENERLNERLVTLRNQRDEAEAELEKRGDEPRDPHAATAITSSPPPHELPEDHPCYKPLDE